MRYSIFFTTTAMVLLASCFLPILAQDTFPDEEPLTNCTEETKAYNTPSFLAQDFLEVDSAVVLGETISLSQERLDTEILTLGLDQPFLVDLLAEGAGASHTFGFFFLDIDTDKDGVPDFLETGPNDDLDGDVIPNIDDPDDDNDGILDEDDTQPAGITSMPASYFRFGPTAAANGETADDYWQFVPNNVLTEGPYTGYFEHPGAYLYIDNNTNNIPDMLEYNAGSNKIPPYALDKDYTTLNINGTSTPGFLGLWSYSGTPGESSDKLHWTGSTIFRIADDDGSTGQTWQWASYSPYAGIASDTSSSTDANLDYLIYSTTDPTSPNVPALLKNDQGTTDPSDDTFQVDARGQPFYKYRWYQSNISGARELVFFLTVYWDSGGSQVNTYFSKSGFNRDPAPSGAWNSSTTGDDFGGYAGKQDWFPRYQNVGDHNELALAVFNVTNWTDIATAPTNGTSPVAVDSANQDWVNEWQNWQNSTHILQYRALSDWFDETAVNASELVLNRYGINMNIESENTLVRSINSRMAHLMVGAPSNVPDARILGWEDLYGSSGPDRDYDDLVFYVKREAGGQLQSLNVAQSLLDQFEDPSLSQITFTFKDNFTDDNWGIPGRFINYAYRLASADEWIPLIGGNHERTPDLFQPSDEGSTVTNGNEVTRTVVIEVRAKKTEIYWRVIMGTDNVDGFQPEILDAQVSFQTLVHDFYYQSSVIPNANINYIAAFETPDSTWPERTRSRGHLYAQKTFDPGDPPTSLVVTVSPEINGEAAPVEPFQWDAGITMRDNLVGGVDRRIYTYIQNDSDETYSNNLTQLPLSKDNLDTRLVNEFALSSTRVNGVWVDNFHDPGADVPDQASAALWLVNWLHGYDEPMVADGVVESRVMTRTWPLGGIDRPSPLVVRAPGIPSWLLGRSVPVEAKRSYLTFIDSNTQKNLPTRVIIGTEEGMLHCFDAGQWVGNTEDSDSEDFEDGRYTDFGNGSEIWGILPGHLLDDLKYNNTRASSVTAQIQSTAISRVIRFSDNSWHRIAVISQGWKGGTHSINGQSITGGYIWAVDITDPDVPVVLWQRHEPTAQDLVNPVSIAWAELSGRNPTWVVAYSSGANSPNGEAPRFYILGAESGAKILERTVGTASSDNLMVGGPALLDTDGNGYVDHLVGATSEGLLFSYNMSTDATVSTHSVNDARFYLTPNVRLGGDDEILFLATSSDHPLKYDHDKYTGSNSPTSFTNKVYGITFDIKTGAWTDGGSYSLPVNHKVFSRPLQVGDRLVLGTSTGDTVNLCDFDPADPGSLFLVDVSDLANLALLDQVAGLGPMYAPITEYGGTLYVHTNTTSRNDPNKFGSVFGQRKIPEPAEAQPTVIAEIFGVLGAQDDIYQRLLEIGNN